MNSLRWMLWIALPICLGLAGCRTQDFSTEYGASKGWKGKASINGFGAVRQAYLDAGFRDRDVSRLTRRAKEIDTLVWTPRQITPITNDVTKWMEGWLRQGKRTLVYVVPDSGSEADYWRVARPTADPKQRLEYRRRWAQSLNRQQEWTLNRTIVPSNGWFELHPKLQETTAKEMLFGDVDTQSGRLRDISAPNQMDQSVRLEWVIEPFDKDESKQKANSVTPPVGPTGPGGFAWYPYFDVKPTKSPTRFEAVASNRQGNALVARITSERWKDSKIIVVAGGSLLTNFAMARATNRQLLQSLIDESHRPASDPLAGFCSLAGEIPVSEVLAAQPGKTGWELLTVYPLSLVTIHAALLGLIICLMIFPIFGRPRKVDRGSLNDFGDHLDAVAALMKKNGDESYARKQISDYMRRVRGETSGPWVMPEHESSQALPPLPNLASGPNLAPNRRPVVATDTDVPAANPNATDAATAPLDQPVNPTPEDQS